MFIYGNGGISVSLYPIMVMDVGLEVAEVDGAF